jgi:pSer/pThr/pTyr-binding forkhead associated (FHA) protein
MARERKQGFSVMDLHLVVVSGGPRERQSIRIHRLPFFIGREATCDLRPSSLYVSKRHCVLLQREGCLFVQDLGSANGTFVNDQEVIGEKQ